MDEPPIIETPSVFERIRKSFASPEFKLYCSYFFSSWGDRMWEFALSIALGVIGGDLQYTAISGLVNSTTVLLFASVVGRWVDKTARLHAARMALIINNFAVAMSSSILVVVLFLPQSIGQVWNGALSVLLISASILLCALSVLANCVTKICITKDWVVVIAGADKERLANINSMMVRIDMASMVLSPLLSGQIMASFGTGWGCAFISCWNVASFLVEYFMQVTVYNSCPALAVKRRPDQEIQTIEEHVDDEETEAAALANSPTVQETHSSFRGDGAGWCIRCWPAVGSALESVLSGYRSYFHQAVLPAGLALASLYLTVLGFDGTTTVYMLSLGLAENWIAICNGAGAIMGFAGSVAYPRLRRNIGLHRTGLIAMTMQWSCLLLPVASVWLPGSNFDPSAVFGGSTRANVTSDSRLAQSMGNGLELFGGGINNTGNNTEVIAPVSRCSSVAFITGIVLSRMGLWIADMAIAQLFQENVAEHERGVVNGVQNSLNSIMDILKGVLVIILPDPRTFGILIIISWAAVFFGYLCYCYYSRSQRGHILPFHKQFGACIAKDGAVTVRTRSTDSLTTATR